MQAGHDGIVRPFMDDVTPHHRVVFSPFLLNLQYVGSASSALSSCVASSTSNLFLLIIVLFFVVEHIVVIVQQTKVVVNSGRQQYCVIYLPTAHQEPIIALPI